MTNLKPSFYPTESECISAHRKPPGEEDYIREVQTNPELKWKFEVVPHFFKQDDPNTNDREFSYIEDDFGKLKLWAEITKTLTDLNSNAAPNECYKLIFCARHGQGYHNVAMEKYGTQEWRSKWNRLDTDGEIVWAPDPPLTDMGVAQAKCNNEAWKREVAEGAPIPTRFYLSPLRRSCDTCLITWDGLRPESTPVVIDKLLREAVGIDSCDKMSPRKVIIERYPNFSIDDPTNAEDDESYPTDHRETFTEINIRINKFLQKLFNADTSKEERLASQVVSTTSHAGTIRSFIMVTNHRRFAISTGGMIPLFVKGTRH